MKLDQQDVKTWYPHKLLQAFIIMVTRSTYNILLLFRLQKRDVGLFSSKAPLFMYLSIQSRLYKVDNFASKSLLGEEKN